MAALPLPPLELLRQLFLYNPETGEALKRPRTPDMFKCDRPEQECRRWNTRYAWQPAGKLNADNHYQTKVEGKTHTLHRLLYAMHHNEYLDVNIEIDHINGIPDDNRIVNLRKATREQQMKNLKIQTNNTSGVKGVSWDKRAKKWVSRINIDKKRVVLGWFQNFEEAAKIRMLAEIKYYGEYRRK